jgi:hypothetical protein
MRKLVGVAVVVCALFGCVTVPQSPRSIKSAEYPGVSYERAFDAVMTVFQDLCASIEWGSIEIGFLTAKTVDKSYEVAFTSSPGSVRIKLKIFTASDDEAVRGEATQEMYDEFWGRLNEQLQD